MAIKKIQLPGGETLDIHDARISGIDASPTQNSDNVVASGGVYEAILQSNPVSYGTTAYWRDNLLYIPKQGEIVVYTDHYTRTDDGKTINIPGIKIGDGNAYGIDLPFIDDKLAADLLGHIDDSERHITAAERASWNNKLCLHANPVIDNTLILYND